MPAVNVLLDAAAISRLKEHRFQAAYRSSPADYLTNPSIGWVTEGTVITIKHPFEIEPYAGIYKGSYIPSLGATRSHGLCSIGSWSYSYSPLPETMVVGRHCSISSGVKILDSQHPIDRLTSGHASFRRSVITTLALEDRGITFRPPGFKHDLGKPYPKIGHDVWIGQDVVLSMGITIGTGAVVAANSLVTRDVPPYAIVGGMPAKVIRYRFDKDTIERLLASEWFRYDWRDFVDIPMNEVPAFLDSFAERQSELTPYEPALLRFPDDFITIN